ncbi:unnamed protein product [Staurois parvus]|uniref:Uncharacterized protein n=1 Tax=Staurois parvus TaxID=386267 RepID=A0ABN9ENV7_9NEOB|nr:unnamed protein product [Staurois parvus]
MGPPTDPRALGQCPSFQMVSPPLALGFFNFGPWKISSLKMEYFYFSRMCLLFTANNK